MRLIGYVVRRGDRFHFRRSVPLVLQSRLERRELVRSLGTGEARLARTRAGELYLLSEAIFEIARDDSSMLSNSQLTGLVQAFYDHVLDRENELRLGVRSSTFMPQPLPEELRRQRAAYFADLAESTREALATNRLADAAMISEAIIRSNGIGELSAAQGRAAQGSAGGARWSAAVSPSGNSRTGRPSRVPPGKRASRPGAERSAAVEAASGLSRDAAHDERLGQADRGAGRLLLPSLHRDQRRQAACRIHQAGCRPVS
jgi:hypothetical protein